MVDRHGRKTIDRVSVSITNHEAGMRPSNLLSRPLWGGLLLASVCLCTARPAGGQELDRVRFGIGYVANAPSQMVGVGGYVLLPVYGGLGLYVDVKGDIDDPSGDRAFDGSRTAEEVEKWLRGQGEPSKPHPLETELKKIQKALDALEECPPLWM